MTLKRLMCAAVLLACLPLVQAQTGLEIFEEETTRFATVDMTEDSIIRTRLVSVNKGRLDDRSGKVNKAVVLNLFEDAGFNAVILKRENNRGVKTISGYLEDIDGGSFAITINNRDDVVVGNVTFPGGFYKIRYAGNGVTAIHEVDTDRMPPDGEPIPVEANAEKRSMLMPDVLERRADSGATIDVLVVYTPSARSAEGGASAMNSLINLAISETNTSYANSGVNHRLNLVHSAEVSYTETGNFSTDLGRLKSQTDGYIDNVHSLRDQYCADEVVMIIQGSQYCGIAYLMSTVSSSFEDSAFAVVARTCATGYYSFGHEIGHNMACRHDWYVDSSTSPYTYNHAYVDVPNRWRTVMGYNSECSASGVSCTRIQYWSNTTRTYGGDPMGVSGTGVGSAADNARTLNNTAYTVANFRDSTAPGGCGGTQPPAGCQGDYSGSGTLNSSNTYDYHPNNTYYYASTSGVHEADLTGDAGTDFDLKLWKWNGSGWSTVASSLGSTSTESISYSGTAGYYVWRVERYSGSGDYDICASGPGM